MLICCMRYPSRYYSPSTSQRSRTLYRLNWIRPTGLPLFESSLIQHGNLPTRRLYASSGLVVNHKHPLTAQSLPKFKNLLVVYLAASCDAAVQEYIRSSRRRRRGRFSASISRGTNSPPPPPHNTASRSRLGTYTKSISLDLGRRKKMRGSCRVYRCT